MMRNPNTGRDDVRISARYYEAVRGAILRALDTRPDGVGFSDLSALVESDTDPGLWNDASVGWYTTTVKLDLQARGLIERSGSPQVLSITPEGRSALGGSPTP